MDNRVTYEEAKSRGIDSITLATYICIPFPNSKEYVNTMLHRLSIQLDRILKEEFLNSDLFGKAVVAEDWDGNVLVLDDEKPLI